MELPLFPLHTVLCPGVALPLHVFEDRYRALVAHCLEADAPFGVVLIRDGREIGDGPTSIATVGTTAEIREVSRFSDGRYELLVVGATRFRVESVTVGREPYIVGQVEEFPDRVGDSAAARHLTEQVTERFVRYLTLLQPLDGEEADEIDVRVELEVEAAEEILDEPALADARDEPLIADVDQLDEVERLDEVARRVVIPDDPTILSYLLSGIIQVDQPRRQELLESETTEERLAELLQLIDRELVLLERRFRNYAVDPRQASLRRN